MLENGSFKVIVSLAFLIFTACSWNLRFENVQKKLLESLPLFNSSLDCSRVYKKISKKDFLEWKKEKVIEWADKCLEKQQGKAAFLIFELLLRESKKRKDSVLEIKKWEKKLAEISFYTFKDYERALKHYTNLLEKPLNQEEKFSVQYHIAESFFYLKKYSQSLKETEKCFFDGISLDQEKAASFLKARIFMAKKNFKQALLFFEKQIKKFPEEEAFFREYLALIYELKKDFFSAINELEKIQPSNPFIRQKIKRLNDRQKEQPGF